MRHCGPPGGGINASLKTKGWIAVAVLFAVALLIRSGRLLATDLAPEELGRWKTSESFFFHLTWGVLAGLAFWTNFLSVTLIGACGFYLLFRIKLRRLLPSWFWLATGGILGALPLVVFALFREAPGVGWVQPGSAYNLTDRLSAVFFNALPVVLGINPRDPAAGLFPLSFGFVVYLLLLVLLLGASAGLFLHGKRWDPLATELVEPLAFTGQVLLLARGPVQRYRIKPAVTTRYVRLTLTESDPVNWWSVEAVQVNQQKDP